MELGFHVEVVEGDALTFQADVLMLKYAGRAYGLDRKVLRLLMDADDTTLHQNPPKVGEYRLLPAPGGLASRYILSVGTVNSYSFGYEESQKLGYDMLASLSREGLDVRHVLTTMHGVGFGLDDVETFRSMLLGFAEAAEAGHVPPNLQKVTIIDRELFRVQLMRESLDKFIPPQPEPSAEVDTAVRETADSLQQMIAGVASFDQPYQKPVADATTPHVFVAMPFADEFDDQYYLGIRPAVTGNDLLCIRLDQDESVFTGDIMEQIKNRIKNAQLMIALLDSDNPNVYLEVGYAWGVGTPTILILHEDEKPPFDVQGARLLTYKHIYRLKEQLADEVRALLGQ